jgi:hypothetical protein
MQRAQRHDMLNLKALLNRAQVGGYLLSSMLTARMFAQNFLTRSPTMKPNAQVLAFTALLTNMSAQLSAGARIKARKRHLRCWEGGSFRQGAWRAGVESLHVSTTSLGPLTAGMKRSMKVV